MLNDNWAIKVNDFHLNLNAIMYSWDSGPPTVGGNPPKLASVICTTWSLNRKVGHKIRKVAACCLCMAGARWTQAMWKEDTIHQRSEHREMKMKNMIQISVCKAILTRPKTNMYPPTCTKNVGLKFSLKRHISLVKNQICIAQYMYSRYFSNHNWERSKAHSTWRGKVPQGDAG